MSIAVVTGKKITNEPVIVYKNRRTNFNSNIHSFDFYQNDLNTDRATYNSSYDDDDDEDLYTPTSNRIITVYHSNNIPPRDNRIYDNQIKVPSRKNDHIKIPPRKNDRIEGPPLKKEYGANTKPGPPKQNDSTSMAEKRGRTISPTRNNMDDLPKKPPHDKRKAHLNNIAASKLKSEKLKALADKEEGERRREYVQQMDNIRRKQAHDKAVASASLQEISPLKYVIDDTSTNTGNNASSSASATLSRKSASSITNNGVYHNFYQSPQSHDQLSINSPPPPPPPPTRPKHAITANSSLSHSQSISLSAKSHASLNKPADPSRNIRVEPTATTRLSIPDLPKQIIASEKQQQEQQRRPKPSQAEPDTGVIIKPRPKKKSAESGSDLDESFEEELPEFPPSRRGAANPTEDSDNYSDDIDDNDGDSDAGKTSQVKQNKVEFDPIQAKKILLESKRKRKAELLKAKQQSEKEKLDKEDKLKALSNKCRKLAPPPPPPLSSLPSQISQGLGKEDDAQPLQLASENVLLSAVPVQGQLEVGEEEEEKRIEDLENTGTIDADLMIKSEKKFDTNNIHDGPSSRRIPLESNRIENSSTKSKNSNNSHKRTEKSIFHSSEEKKKNILADQRKARDEEMKKAKKDSEEKKLLREQQLKLLSEKSQKVATIPIKDLLRIEEEERQKLTLENKNVKKKIKHKKEKIFLPQPQPVSGSMKHMEEDMEETPAISKDSKNNKITDTERNTKNNSGKNETNSKESTFVHPSGGDKRSSNQDDTSSQSSSEQRGDGNDRQRYNFFDSDDINDQDGEYNEDRLVEVQQKPYDFDEHAIGKINDMISTFAGVHRPASASSAFRDHHGKLADDGNINNGIGDNLHYPNSKHISSLGRQSSQVSTRYSGNRYEYEYSNSQDDHLTTSNQNPSTSGGVNTSHPRLNNVAASRRISPYDSIPYAVAGHMSSSYSKPPPASSAMSTVSAPSQPVTFQRPLTADARYQTQPSHRPATRSDTKDVVEELRYGRHHERRDTSSSRSRSRSRSKTPTIVKRVTRSTGNQLSHADAETPFRMGRQSDRTQYEHTPSRLADNKRAHPSFPNNSNRNASKSAIVDKYQRIGKESFVTANERGRSKQSQRSSTTKNYTSQSSSRSRSGSRSTDRNKFKKRSKDMGGLGSTVVYSMRQGEIELSGRKPANLGGKHATLASKNTSRGDLPPNKGGYLTKNLFADDVTNLIYEDSQSEDGDNVLFADNDSEDFQQKENKPYDRNNNRNTAAITDKYNKLQAMDKAKTSNKEKDNHITVSTKHSNSRGSSTQVGLSEPEPEDRVTVIDKRKGFHAADGSIDIVMFTRVLGEVERIQAMLTQINKDIELTVAEQVRESVLVLPKDPPPSVDGRESTMSTLNNMRIERRNDRGNVIGLPTITSGNLRALQEEEEDGDVPETISGKSQSGSSYYSGSQSDGSVDNEAPGRMASLPNAADLNMYLNYTNEGSGPSAPSGSSGNRKYLSSANPNEAYLLAERQRYPDIIEDYEENVSNDDGEVDRQVNNDLQRYRGWENNENLQSYDNNVDDNNELGQDEDYANRSYHSEDDNESLQVQRAEFRKSIDNVLMQSVRHDSHAIDHDMMVANGLPTLRSGVSLLLPRNPSSKLSDDPYLNFSLGILQDQRDVMDRYASDDAMRAILESQKSSRDALEAYHLNAPGKDTSPPLQPSSTHFKSTGQITSNPKNFTAVAVSDEPDEEKAYLPSLRNVGELGSVFNMPSYKYPIQGRSVEEDNISWSSADSSDHGLSIVSIVANEILRKQERDAANQYEREREEILKASARNALKTIEDDTLHHHYGDFADFNDNNDDDLGFDNRDQTQSESPREADTITEQQFWENVQRVPVQKRAVLIQQWYDEKDRNAHHRNKDTSPPPAIILSQDDNGIEEDDFQFVGDTRSRSTLTELEPLHTISAGRARYNPSEMTAESDFVPSNTNRYSQHTVTGFGTRDAASSGVAASDAKEPRRLSPADLHIQLTDQLRRQDDIFKYSLELSELEQANTIQSASKLVQSAITQVEREAFEARRIQELSLQRQSYEIGLKSAMAAAEAVIREEALAREVVVAELKNTVAQQQIHGQYAQYMAQAAQVADNLHSTSLLLEIEQRMPNLSQATSHPVSNPAVYGKEVAAINATATGNRKERNVSNPTSPNEKQKKTMVPNLPIPLSNRQQKMQQDDAEGEEDEEEEEEEEEEEDYSQSFEQDSRLGRNLSQSYLSVPKSSARTTRWEKSNNDESISEDISQRDFAAASIASLSQSRKSRGTTDRVDESRYTEDFDDEDDVDDDEVLEEEEDIEEEGVDDAEGKVVDEDYSDDNYESVSSSLTTSPRSMQGTTSRKEKSSKPLSQNPPRSFKELEPIQEHSRSRSLSEDLDGISDSFRGSNRNSPKKSSLGTTGLAASLESSLKLKFGKIDKNSSLALTKLINDDSTNSHDISPRSKKLNSNNNTLASDTNVASEMLAEYRAEMESRMRSQEKSLKIRLHLLKSKRKEQMNWILKQRESLETSKRTAKGKANELNDITKKLQQLLEEEKRFMSEFEEARAELERERWTINAKAYKELRSFNRLKKDMEQYEHNLVAKNTKSKSKSLPDVVTATKTTANATNSSKLTSKQIEDDSNMSIEPYSSESFIEDEEEEEAEGESSIRTDDHLKRRIGGGGQLDKSKDEVDDEISEAGEDSYASETIRTVEEIVGNNDYSDEFEVEESLLASSSVASKSYSGISFRSTVEKKSVLRNDALKKKTATAIGTSTNDDKSEIMQQVLKKSISSIDAKSLADREAAVKRKKQEAEALIRQKKEEIELRKRQIALEEEERMVNKLFEEALAIDVDQQIEEDRKAIQMKAKKDVEEAASKLSGLRSNNKTIANLSTKDKSQPKPAASATSQKNNKIIPAPLSIALRTKAKQSTQENTYDDDDFDEVVEEEVPEEEEEVEEDEVEESFEEIQESDPEVSDDVVEEEEEKEDSYLSSHNVSGEVEEDMDEESQSRSRNNNATSQSIAESIVDSANNDEEENDVEESYSTYGTESMSISRPSSRTSNYRSEKPLANDPRRASTILDASTSQATLSYDMSYEEEEESRLASTSSRNIKVIPTKIKASKSNPVNKSVEFSVTYADDFDVSTVDKIPPKEHQKVSQNIKSGIANIPQKTLRRENVSAAREAEVSVGSGSSGSSEAMERSDDTLKELESSYDRHRLHIEELKAKLKQSQKEKLHLEKLKIKKSERDQLLREETELLQKLQEEQEALFKEKAELHRALGKGVNPTATTTATITATATQIMEKSTVTQQVPDTFQSVLSESSSLALQEKLLEVDMRSATVGRQWFQTLTEPLADEQNILETEAELEEDSWASDDGAIVKGNIKGGSAGKNDILNLLADKENIIRSTIRKQQATVMIQSMFRRKLACLTLKELKTQREGAKRDLEYQTVQGDLVEDLEVVAIQHQELLEDSFASTADSEEDRVEREFSELMAQDIVVNEQLQEVESKRSNLANELAARGESVAAYSADRDSDSDGDISIGEEKEEDEVEASTDGREVDYEREFVNNHENTTTIIVEQDKSYHLQVDASLDVDSDADADGDSSYVESASTLLSPISNDSPLRSVSASALTTTTTPPMAFKNKRSLTVVVDDNNNEEEKEVDISSGSEAATVAWSSSKLDPPEATLVVPSPVLAPIPIVEKDSDDIEEVLEEEEVIEEEEEDIEKEKAEGLGNTEEEEEEEYQLDDYEEEFESDSLPSSSPIRSKNSEIDIETTIVTQPVTVENTVSQKESNSDGPSKHNEVNNEIPEEEDIVEEELDEYEDYESDHEESQLELPPAVEQGNHNENETQGFLGSQNPMEIQQLDDTVQEDPDDYEEFFEVSEEIVTSFRGLVSSEYDLVEVVKKPITKSATSSPIKESSGHKVEFSPLPDEIFEISEEEITEEKVEDEEDDDDDLEEESFNQRAEIDIEKQTDFITSEIWKRMCKELQHELPHDGIGNNSIGVGDEFVSESQSTTSSTSAKTIQAGLDYTPITTDTSSLSSLSDIPPVIKLLPKSASTTSSTTLIESNDDLDDLYADFETPSPVIALPVINKKKVESGYGKSTSDIHTTVVSLPTPTSPYVTYTQDTINYLGDIFAEVSDEYLFTKLSDPNFKGPLLSDELFIEIELKSEEASQQQSSSSSSSTNNRNKNSMKNHNTDNIIAIKSSSSTRPRSSSEIKLSQHLKNLIFDRTNDILASIHSLRHFGTCSDNSFLSHVPLAQRFLAQNIPLKSSVLAEFVKKQLIQEHMIYLKEECIYDTPADVVDVRLLDSFADEVLREENKDIDRITDIILANCLLDTSNQVQHVFR